MSYKQIMNVNDINLLSLVTRTSNFVISNIYKVIPANGHFKHMYPQWRNELIESCGSGRISHILWYVIVTHGFHNDPAKFETKDPSLALPWVVN